MRHLAKACRASSGEGPQESPQRMLTVDIRFVRYCSGCGVANIELVFVYNEEGSDTVHWIYPQPNKKKNGTSGKKLYNASTVEIDKDTLNSKTYQTVYDRDVAPLRIAVDSKKPDILIATVRAPPAQQAHMPPCNRFATLKSV